VRVFILIAAFWGLSSQAAYRVYKLKVESYNAKGKLERTEVVLSSLDHFQYEHYYGGYRWMKVQLLDTWYCSGDTAHRRYCDRPKEPPLSADRVPSSVYDHPSRVQLPYSRQPVIP